jgi:ABC-type transporter Mla subunit MlaD
MPDEPENLILQHLRAIRGDVEAVRDTLAEHTGRLGRLERSMADVGVQLADHSVRFDRVNAQLDRIDRRLGLIDA